MTKNVAYELNSRPVTSANSATISVENASEAMITAPPGRDSRERYSPFFANTSPTISTMNGSTSASERQSTPQNTGAPRYTCFETSAT